MEPRRGGRIGRPPQRFANFEAELVAQMCCVGKCDSGLFKRTKTEQKKGFPRYRTVPHERVLSTKGVQVVSVTELWDLWWESEQSVATIKAEPVVHGYFYSLLWAWCA